MCNLRDTKTVIRKLNACDIPATKYGISAVEVERKIQALKTQFLREHKKLVDSNRRGNSPKKAFSKTLSTS
jgi:hypothetical protein